MNGPSNAGKTTLCRALQGQDEPDAFTALGAEMETTSPPGAPLAVTARFGPVFRRLLDSMAPVVLQEITGN